MEAAKRQRRRIAVAAVAVAAAAILAIGLATSRSVAAGPEAVPSPQATEYLPSISDLMIATIQPRHEQLWLAEQDGNWEFAAYELGNLKGAFNRVGQAHPTVNDISFPQMMTSVTEQPFKELGGAIQAKDNTAFDKAYADQTGAIHATRPSITASFRSVYRTGRPRPI